MLVAHAGQCDSKEDRKDDELKKRSVHRGLEGIRGNQSRYPARDSSNCPLTDGLACRIRPEGGERSVAQWQSAEERRNDEYRDDGRAKKHCKADEKSVAAEGADGLCLA